MISVATGAINCHLGTTPVTGWGFSYSADELDIVLSSSIAGISGGNIQ